MSFNKCSQIDKVIYDLSKIPTHTYQSNGGYGSKYTNIVYSVNGEPKRIIINKMMGHIDLNDIQVAIADIRNNKRSGDTHKYLYPEKYEDDNIAEEKGIWIDTDIYDADAPLLLLSKEVWDALVKYVERKFNEPVRSG